MLFRPHGALPRLTPLVCLAAPSACTSHGTASGDGSAGGSAGSGATTAATAASGESTTAPPATAGSSTAGSDGSAGTAGTGSPPPEPSPLAWIDVHMHGGGVPGSPDVSGWAKWGGAPSHPADGAGAVTLSLAYRYIDIAIAMAKQVPYNTEEEDLIKNMNQIYADTAASISNMWWFAGLECWAAPIQDPGWVDLCKSQVDQWLAAGALGFKDHAGEMNNMNDNQRFLASFNIFNGFCDPPFGTPQARMAARTECMKTQGVRYPMLHPKWREVLAYILEDRGVHVISHAVSAAVDVQCWPEGCEGGAACLTPCGEVTLTTIMGPGGILEWASDTLSAEARSRLVLAHGGGLVRVSDDKTDIDTANLETWLAAGLSVDISQKDLSFGRSGGVLTPAQAQAAGCTLRRVIGEYPGQILFGTDMFLKNQDMATTYAMWDHILTGELSDAKSFGGQPYYGLNLDVADDPLCPDTPPLPDGTLDAIRTQNAWRLLGAPAG